jgi:23S rRNA (guanosine2251-2'-O)-methyltransferase
VACTEKASDSLYDQKLTDPVALIMGSEEDGISHDFIRMADHMCKLPINGQIQSLNVGVAASVALYEAVRQRVG